MPKLTVYNQDKSWELKKETELVRLPFMDSSIPIKFGCCQGNCGSCAIMVREGKENLSPMNEGEKKTLIKLKFDISTHRLACQCSIRGNVIIDISVKKIHA